MYDLHSQAHDFLTAMCRINPTLCPEVHITFTPPVGHIPYLDNNVQLQQSVMTEALSINEAYKERLPSDFTPLSPPVSVAVGVQYTGCQGSFKSAYVALTHMMSRLENPGPSCPVINALPPGTFICTLRLDFDNLIAQTDVYRRNPTQHDCFVVGKKAVEGCCAQ